MSVGPMSSAIGLRGIAAAIRPHARLSPASHLSRRYLHDCQRHDTYLRMRRDSIRQHIRGLGEARRRFTTGAALAHAHIDPPKPGEELHVTFIDKDGDTHEFEVAEGNNLLDIAQANDLEMEGACGGSCACSTCHVIVQDEAVYDKIPEADDDEVSVRHPPLD